MKTFNLYVNEDIENPYFHYRDGSSLLGPGMGQYDPIADLNAQKQMLGKLQVKGNFKEITKSDLDQIEKYADRLFGALDIDVEFTRHFLDRVNDMRNKVAITPAELTRLFKQTYKKHGKTIARLGPDAEAVITDMKTDINMPFVLNLKGGELELVAKTVMRKKNFKTTNPKLAFEDVSEARAKKAVAGGKVQKLVTAHGLTYKGKKYKEIDMELVKIDNSSEVVTFNIIHPKEIFGDEVKIPFRTLRRGPFMATDTSKINEGTYFTRTRSNKSRGQIMKKQLRPKIEPLMKDIGFKRGSYKMEPSSNASQLIITVDKSDLEKVKKALKPLGLPNIVQVVSEGRKTIKVGEDALLGDGSPHYALVSHREILATGTKEDMLELSDEVGGRVWLTKSNVGDIVESNTEYV